MRIVRIKNGLPVGKVQTINGTTPPTGYIAVTTETLKTFQRHELKMVDGKPVEKAVDMPLSVAMHYKKQEIASARWQECSGSFLWTKPDGSTLWADCSEQARLSVKVKSDEAKESSDPNWGIGWKFSDQFVLLNKDDMISLYDAGLAFIEERFVQEAMLHQQIEAVQTLDDLRGISWIKKNWYPDSIYII